jgi:shikimate dehydrogenase
MSRSYRFAVLGQSISYSKSPDVFAAISEYTDIPISFEIRSIGPSQLEVEIQRLRAEGYDALALTTPFKEQIIPLLSSVSPTAKKIQAVNSVKCGETGLSGYNTDIDGFLAGLMPFADKVTSAKALVLGTGGAARAVIHALLSDGPATSVTVVGRSRESLGKMAGYEFEFLTVDNLQTLPNKDLRLIVNCTPLGGWNALEQLPLPPEFQFAPDTVYYDLNYNEGNRAIQFAAEGGCTTIDGSVMLVGQALKSFFLWADESIPIEPIYQAVFGRGHVA